MSDNTAATIRNLTSRNPLPLTDSEFEQFRALIYDRAGIYFNQTKKYLLATRLMAGVRELGLGSFAEYYGLVRSAPLSDLSHLFEAVTTNETFFFRNAPQLRTLQKEVLPRLMAGPEVRQRAGLRIWSVGCSSGEEPYTLAIVLDQVMGRMLDDWDVEILAVDISQKMLDHAKAGVYSKYSLRRTPPAIINKYFIKRGDRYEVKDRIKKMVRFEQMNLKDDKSLRRVGRMALIFCRNVIIYFDKPMTRSVLGHFYRAMNPGGYLFLGHAETLTRDDHSFKPALFAGASLYQKPEIAPAPPSPPPVRGLGPSIPGMARPQAAPA